MKKQILILSLFTLALIFAGTSKSYGQQAVHNSDPQAVACSPDELHPSAGIPYTYTLDATPGGGTWNWYATKNTTFINGAVIPNDSLKQTANQLDYTTPNYGTSGSSNSVTITWSEAILANTTYQTNPTFVVGYYAASGAIGDCADNIKIYELDPTFAFVVDVKNIDPADNSIKDYGTDVEQCVDNVQGASYTAAHQILYDYGTNYLYYEFIAANFSDYWVPTFAVTGLTTPPQTLTYEYTYAAPSTWATTPPTWTALVSGTTHIEVDPSVASTEHGVSVYVRVTVANNTFETLADQTVLMTLDGQNSNNMWDVQNTDCGLPNPNAADQDDTSTQKIDKRPTVIEGTTSTVNPNTNLVPKQ